MSQPTFVEQVFRFLLHDPSSLNYMPYLRADYFIDPAHSSFFSALEQYYGEYQTLPIFFSSFEQYVEEGIKDSGADVKAGARQLLSSVKHYWKEVKYDKAPVQKSIIEYAKRQELKAMLVTGGSMVNGTVDTNALQEHLTRLSGIGDMLMSLEGNLTDNFALAGIHAMSQVHKTVIPCVFDGINDFRPLGGNTIGEHYVVLSGTKSFKTMFALNMAVGYLRMGKSVYYVDSENGVGQILQRVRQALTRLSVPELYSDEGKELLKQQAERILTATKADFYVDYYKTGACFEDIEARIDLLKRAYNFSPQVVIYDDLDHFTHKQARSNKTTHWALPGELIAMATDLNNKIGAISWQLAQVTKQANSKGDDWDETDIATSFAKVKIAHGVVGMFKVDNMGDSMIKVECLVQREGKPRHLLTPVYLEVDGERQLFTERKDFMPEFEAPKPAKRKR